MAVERKYQMVRVSAGDYMLMSNSGKSLWRFRRYHEYGMVEYDDGTKLVGDFWSCARYDYRGRSMPNGTDQMIDVIHDPERWVTTADTLRTRQEAIDEALAAAERRGI
jgi:hypothetical protein